MRHTGAKTSCLNLALWGRQREGRREKDSEKEKRSDRKHMSDSVKRSGVQLLTPLHTQLQKNRTARSGLNWCTRSPTLVGQLDRLAIKVPVKVAWTSARKISLLHPFSICPKFSMGNHSHILYLSDSGTFQATFRESTHLRRELTQTGLWQAQIKLL